jgi:cobalt/nickel transport system ATP-binding protein
MSHHKVALNQVSYTYPDGNGGVKNIDFTIEHGASVGIIGANGAGKSTLLKLLTGLLICDEGAIYIGETKVTSKSLPFIRQSLGFTFQEADHQLFMNSVYDDVAFGPRNYQMEDDEVERRVVKALEMVDALHLKNRASYKLSGGEKRAVAIATVLVMDPSVLIMDEPSVALDPYSRRHLIGVLDRFEHTKIIATHDMDLVYDLCDHVLVLKEGELIRSGAAKEILNDDLFLKSCKLERPLRLQGCP